MITIFLLGLARFSLIFWLGAAVLFVLVTVTEILSGKLDTLQLDQLVLLRFPVYYRFSLITLSLGWICLIAGWLLAPPRWTIRLSLSAYSLALLLLVGDYLWVYAPLREMLLPLGSPRPHTFHQYHQLTEWLNTGVLSLNALAVIGLHFPTDRVQPPLK